MPSSTTQGPQRRICSCRFVQYNERVTNTCSVDGCGNPVKVIKRGLCSKHYQRLMLHGDPLAGGRAGHAPRAGLEERTCPICDKEYMPYRSNQRACSREHYRRLPDVAAAVATHHAQPQVKELKNAARRIGTAKDPAYRRLVNLKNALRRYGLTPDELANMIATQGNRCAICGESPDPNGIKAASRLHVDHDHSTGQVRQLLCNNCNRGIGYLKDDPVLVRAAADYIERHRMVGAE